MNMDEQASHTGGTGDSAWIPWSSFGHGMADLKSGVRMSYRSAGQGDVVVLVHGWPQHAQMWHAIAPRMAANYKVIAPDLRGAGGSTIRGPFDKATMAEDVVQLVDSLDVEKFGLVG